MTKIKTVASNQQPTSKVVWMTGNTDGFNGIRIKMPQPKK